MSKAALTKNYEQTVVPASIAVGFSVPLKLVPLSCECPSAFLLPIFRYLGVKCVGARVGKVNPPPEFHLECPSPSGPGPGSSCSPLSVPMCHSHLYVRVPKVASRLLDIHFHTWHLHLKVSWMWHTGFLFLLLPPAPIGSSIIILSRWRVPLSPQALKPATWESASVPPSLLLPTIHLSKSYHFCLQDASGICVLPSFFLLPAGPRRHPPSPRLQQ